MFLIKPAKEIKGTVVVPPSPDLYFLSALCTLSTDQNVRIFPVVDTPYVRMFEKLVMSHKSIVSYGDTRVYGPAADPSPEFVFSFAPVPFLEFCIFFVLGRKLYARFPVLSQTRIDRLFAIATRCGCVLNVTTSEAGVSLSLTEKTFSIPDVFVDQDDLSAYIGLVFGLGRMAELRIDYPFVSPLRHILPLFGHQLTVKNDGPEKSNDPLLRRLKFLQPKKKSDSTLSFRIYIDCSKQNAESEIAISLPGDDLFASLMISAKALVPRGSLVIENVPLETFSTQLLQHIRKMGCKPGIQETKQTSFGALGHVTMQKFALIGRKIDCIPMNQFINQLPAMAVLAAASEGQTVFKNLEQMRADATDSVEELRECLKIMGVRLGEMPDGIVIDGGKHQYDGFDFAATYPAHVAGAFAIAALKCVGDTTIPDTEILNRWPDFAQVLSSICEFRE